VYSSPLGLISPRPRLNEAGLLPIQQYRVAAPAVQSASVLPQHYLGASRPETTQSHGFIFPDQATSAINKVYQFDGDWGHFANVPSSCWTGYATMAKISLLLALPTTMPFGILQNYKACSIAVTTRNLTPPSRHTAAANNRYGGMPDFRSIWPSQTPRSIGTRPRRTPTRGRGLDCVEINCHMPAGRDTHG
jgi:hypothetical protein